jgi:hypothetical protein
MDLVKHRGRQIEFSLHTFGPGQRTAGVLEHIRKELTEIEERAATTLQKTEALKNG